MPSRRNGGNLILFSADDPQPLVSFLVEKHGIQKVLELLAREQIPGGMSLPAKRASKKGGKRGRPKGSKSGAKKSGKRSRKATGPGGAGETGKG